MALRSDGGVQGSDPLNLIDCRRGRRTVCYLASARLPPSRSQLADCAFRRSASGPTAATIRESPAPDETLLTGDVEVHVIPRSSSPKPGFAVPRTTVLNTS
jgi:hypothetical protein